MSAGHGQYERIRAVLDAADEPLTAREILDALDDDVAIESPHQVATVLGRFADRGAVDVIRDRPYRYRL